MEPDNLKPLKNTHLAGKVVAILILLLLGALFAFYSKNNPDFEPQTETHEPILSLSADARAILSNQEILLDTKNEAIFNYFKNSFLCDESNINSDSERPNFCQNQEFLAGKTTFTNFYLSPDKQKMIFTVTSEVLTPDQALGIYYLDSNEVTIFSDYYIGNEFISFSPNGSYFVYKGGCFEATCALYIINTESLNQVAILSDSQYPDARVRDVFFNRWLSNSELEYSLGEEAKLFSIQAE